MDEPEPGEAAAAIFLAFPSPSDVWEDLLIHGVLRNIKNKKKIKKQKKTNSTSVAPGPLRSFLRLALLLLRSSTPAAAEAIHYQQQRRAATHFGPGRERLAEDFCHIHEKVNAASVRVAPPAITRVANVR